MSSTPHSRREFLQSVTAGAGILASAASPHASAAPPGKKPRRPRVAAIFTVLRFRSHAFNILENFLGPYYFNGRLTDPGVDVVAFYADQFPDDDMAREVSSRFGIPLFKTIRETMCVGGDQLAVDAVLSIGEHGDYPWNARGQHLYPRKRFFDESVAVMREAGRFVPFFNDKHLSYRQDWSSEMFQTARQHQMPLLAGSSVPLAQRRPTLELPVGAVIEEAVSIHGGGLESYGFHGLEVLLSFVESRKGGETGIREIQVVFGDAFQRAVREGRWSQVLVDAAMQCESDMQVKRQARPTTGVFATKPKPKQPVQKSRGVEPAGDHAVCLTFNSGLKATVLRVGGSGDRWNFACRLLGETKPRATALFNGPWGNRCLFKALSHAIQHLFITGKEPWPAERTFLTTGAVEAMMRSWENGGAAVATPHLNVVYQPGDWSKFRESGATWSIITPAVPQPPTFQPRLFTELQK